MYQVKFISTGKIYELVNFNKDKIIIRFNKGASIGTVEKTGYKPVENKTWEEIKEAIEKEKNGN